MPAQPVSSSQNTGLVVIVVGIFMVVMTFLAVTYINSDTIKNNQDKNSQRGVIERADLTDVTCALWHSVGKPDALDAATLAKVKKVCGAAR